MSDRTRQAVAGQLRAMACERYEVGILNRKGQMLIREWTRQNVLHAIGWLKHENANGADIYVRPHPEEDVGLVLVDDVEQADIDSMVADGRSPAIVVETSPNNHQAWIRLTQATDRPTRTAAARILARTYGGDPNSADWRHFGRLAGFTNRKPDHTTPQGQPWCLLLLAAPSAMAAKDLYLRAQAEARCGQIVADAVRTESQTALPTLFAGSEQQLHDWYRKLHGRLYRQAEALAARLDNSQLDWVVAVSMFKAGFDYRAVASMVERNSPGIHQRKAGHVRDYIQRTVGRAEIWAELSRQGARYDAVRHRLSALAKRRAKERLSSAQNTRTTLAS